MNIIVAVNRDWGIGFNGSQTIVIPEDRRYFLKMTGGGTVIVGRKTFEDIGSPLPNRKNIILTRDAGLNPAGVIVAHSVNEVLALVAGDEPGKVFVIGGGSVYELFLPICSYAYVTKIEAAPLSDVFFPNLDESPEWTLENQSEAQESTGVRYTYNVYKRR